MIEKDCIDDCDGKNDDCDWSDVFDENQNDGPFCPSNQHANNDFLPLPLELLFQRVFENEYIVIIILMSKNDWSYIGGIDRCFLSICF